MALATISLVAVAAWVALALDARRLAHEAYHKSMAILKLTSPADEGASFWCPMHPEIRRKAPGTCPI